MVEGKVLFVTKSDLSGTAGHNIATREFALALARINRVNVSLVCPAPRDQLSISLEDYFENCYYLSERPIELNTPQRGFMITEMFRILRRAIRHSKPDVMVARMAPLLVAPPVLARFYDVPYALLSRGTAYKSLQPTSVISRVYKHNVRSADHVYAASKEIQQDTDELRKTKQDQTRFLPNGVNPEEFRPLELETVRSELELDLDDEFVIGFVGSMKSYHRVDLLIKSLNHVNTDKEIKLLMVGDGPDLDRYKRLAENEGVSEKMIFTGFVPHEQVNEYISACDVMFGVSDQGSATPVKIYEYLACERPVLVQDIEEMSVISDLDLGRTVDKTPDSIGEAIDELLTADRRNLSDMGQRGREYVAENRTWLKAAERVVSDFI